MQEKFLEAMQERVPRAKFAFGAGESTILNGLELLYEKMAVRPSRNVKTGYKTVKTTSKNQRN